MSDDSNALEPLEERTVLFYDDEIKGVIIEPHPFDPQIFVPVRPLCDFLGVAWSAQRRRLLADAVLSREVETVLISTEGGPQAMLCIPLDFLNGWLFSINANRVRADIRERLILYQQECYRTLSNAFRGPTDLSPEASSAIAALQQIRENALAVARLAEEQIRITSRLDKAAIIVGQHSRRIAALEQKLAPSQAITDEQAAEIAQSVKALALRMAEEEPGKNHFQGIFSELYRRFGVSSYKNIRQGEYQAVLAFLDAWAKAAATR